MTHKRGIMLRLLIVINTAYIRQWHNQCIKYLLEEPNIFVIGLFIAPNTGVCRTIVERMYTSIDYLLFSGNYNAMKKIPVRDALSEMSIITHTQLHECSIDLIIDFSDYQDKSELCNFSRLGLWTFNYYNSNSGYFEVLTNSPIIKTELFQFTKHNSIPELIYSSSTMTHPISITKSQNFSFSKNHCILKRKIIQLCTTNSTSINNCNSTFSNQINVNKSLNNPIKLIYYVVKKWYNHLFRLRKYQKNSKWSLIFSFDNKLTPDGSFTHIVNNEFWADPMIVSFNNDYQIFFEEYDYIRKKGHISTITLFANGTISDTSIVLDKPYHLSYPYIFYYQTNYYMIPESSANGTIDLYKAELFPLKWYFYKTLFNNIRAVDATIFEHNNLWWMFINISESKNISFRDELSLFYATDPIDGIWHPHPLNPVISDTRTARPAGKPFYYNNILYRPSQKSVIRYGYGINLNKIIKLSVTEYLESTEFEIIPEWDKEIIGTHTYSRDKNLLVMDVLRK